jgi:hypothetical protein
MIAMSKTITQNTLFYGDNLPILREHFPDDMPRHISRQTFKHAEKVKRKQGKQEELGI